MWNEKNTNDNHREESWKLIRIGKQKQYIEDNMRLSQAKAYVPFLAFTYSNEHYWAMTL